MSNPTVFPTALLNQAGLNRQHVFDLVSLPDEVTAKLGDTEGFSQLILLGHAGKRLWECVQAAGMVGEDPIDDYVRQTVARFFTETFPTTAYQMLYPGNTPIGLQQLGGLAGWHHPSPFMVGIDSKWGSWFAYRAVILADSGFLPFEAVHRSSPCPACMTRPCVTACPASALSGPSFALDKCIAYRRQPDSACRTTCVARTTCPVGSEHRYSAEQLHHTYSISLRMIEQYYPANSVNHGAQPKQG